MTDRQFYSAAALIAGKLIGDRKVVEWQKAVGGLEAAVSFVARERRFAPDYNDARRVGLLIAEDAAEAE